MKNYVRGQMTAKKKASSLKVPEMDSLHLFRLILTIYIHNWIQICDLDRDLGSGSRSGIFTVPRSGSRSEIWIQI